MNVVLKLLVQVLAILSVGLVTAAVGNAVVEDKLELNRAYFKNWSKLPTDPSTAPPQGNTSQPTGSGEGSAESSGGQGSGLGTGEEGGREPADPGAAVDPPPKVAEGGGTSTVKGHPAKVVGPDGIARIHGIQVVELEDLESYMELGDEICCVLDARKLAQYVEGHLPGAHYADYYKLSEVIDGVRDYLTADFVVVYCNGGDCEDSLSLAHDLIYEYEVPLENVWVFEGGYEEWVQVKGEDSVVKGEEPR